MKTRLPPGFFCRTIYIQGNVPEFLNIQKEDTGRNILRSSALVSTVVFLFCTSIAYADQEGTEAVEAIEEEAVGAAGSNPLASVSKLDLEWEFTKPGGYHVSNLVAKGSVMLHEKVKFNYEFHYAVTDVTGKTENDWKSLNLKPIFFISDYKLSDTWGMRLATGGELILDFNNAEKGIGTGSDQIAPLLGFAFMNFKTKTVLIPLVQHFESYENSTISQTAFRLIGLQPLPNQFWLKLDAKVPYDWENEAVPINSEFEAGKMLSQSVGIFAKALVGIGNDRPFDWGVTGALRFNF